MRGTHSAVCWTIKTSVVGMLCAYWKHIRGSHGGKQRLLDPLVCSSSGDHATDQECSICNQVRMGGLPWLYEDLEASKRLSSPLLYLTARLHLWILHSRNGRRNHVDRYSESANTSHQHVDLHSTRQQGSVKRVRLGGMYGVVWCISITSR